MQEFRRSERFFEYFALARQEKIELTTRRARAGFSS
jgi:hypothetical protein